MKSFRDYLNEEVLPSVQVADGGLDIDKPAVRAAINAAIAGVVSQPAVTPYVVFNRLSKLLAQYHIVLPKRFLEGDKGVEVFEIKQFGHRMGMTDGGEFVSQVPSTHYLFLQYGIITPFGVTYAKPVVGGMFRVMARLVDKAELDQLLNVAEITMKEEAEVRQNAAKNAAMAVREPMPVITSDSKKVGNKKAVADSDKGLSLNEGRPSQRHPLEGHDYHRKSDAELLYIGKDAHAAAKAMRGHNTAAENKYLDQANDAATVRHFRKTSGRPEWYQKKYGHIKEDHELDEAKMTRTQRNLAVRRFMAHDAEAGERILAQGKKDREEKKSFASAKKEISDLKKKNLEETNATNKAKKRDVEADIGARYKKMGFDGRGNVGRHPENKRNDDIGLGRKVLKRDPSNLEEKLTKSMSAGDVISDFAHSKAKTFKGDTKKERISRALGAYYGMHPEKSKKKVNEETKVSKYIPQAANSPGVMQALIQAAARRKKQADSANRKVTKEKPINELYGKGKIEAIASAHHKKAMSIRDKVPDSENPHITAHQRAGVLKNMRDSSNRGAYKGMAKVARAQQKSREKLEEVSKETAASYIPKAAHSIGLIAAKRASKVGRDISYMDTPEYAKSEKKQMMRHRGIARATEKLTKEELKFDPSTEIPRNT